MTTLTALEIRGIKGIIDSDFRDANHPVGYPVWSWSANPFGSKRTFSGVISSLSQKGLVVASGSGEDACVALTAEGLAAYETATGKEWTNG